MASPVRVSVHGFFALAGVFACGLTPSVLEAQVHDYVEARNLVVIYTRSYFPNAPGGYSAQDPRDRRSIETVQRVDPTVDFDFGNDAPPGTDFYPYQYSIRWTGGLEVAIGGTYRFQLSSDADCVAGLYIDGALVVQKRANGYGQPPVEASVALAAGRHPIRVDYVNYFYEGSVRIHWAPPGEPSFAPVPPSQLYPTYPGTTGGGLTGTYYATSNFVDKVEQITKSYADTRQWVWRNTDLRLDTQFDVIEIDDPFSLERYPCPDGCFLDPAFVDSEGRSVYGDLVARGHDDRNYASLAVWSVPLLATDSLGVYRGFYAAGATAGTLPGGHPPFTSIQVSHVEAEITEFGLRVWLWFADPPIGRLDIFPNNHTTEFFTGAPDGFGDTLFFPLHSVSYRALGLADWQLLLARPAGFAARSVADADGDGIPDQATAVPISEIQFGSSSAQRDTDADGMDDFAELTHGFSRSTDPLTMDTDGDGTTDPQDAYPRFPVQQARLVSTPVLDGVISNGEYGTLLATIADPVAPSTLAATVYASWNAGGLNLAVDVVDDSVDPPAEGTDPAYFFGDNLRVRLDFANDGFLRYPAAVFSDNLEIGVAPGGSTSSPTRFAGLHRYDPVGYAVDYTSIPGSAIPAAYRQTPTGYVLELKVPPSPLTGFSPTACTPLALQVQVYDRDLGNSSDERRYQLFPEGGLAVLHDDRFAFDFATNELTGGLGAFVSIVLADTVGQDCHHPPAVERLPCQTLAPGQALRLRVRGSDPDRDRLRLAATLPSGQPLESVGLGFEDRRINLGLLRGQPGIGAYQVNVTATDPQGAAAMSPIIVAVGPSLLTNGGFEQGQTDWTGWSSNIVLGSGLALCGDTSTRFDLGAARTLTHTDIAVTPGGRYQLSAAIKTVDLGKKRAYVRVEWRTDTGILSTQDFGHTSGTADWAVKTSGLLTAPTSATRARVRLQTEPGSGTAHFDEVRLWQP